MNITFQSSVLFVNDFEKMKSFYQEILKLPVELDFGSCITFKNGLSIWKLSPEYPISKELGTCFNLSGNKNLELCFETEDFNDAIASLKKYDIKYLHHEAEEMWGQKTIRIFDPENNLIEIGESIACFVKRFYAEGLTIEEVSKRTFVSIEMVTQIINNKK